ncbi:SEC-C metal-binding domain-containing protein [Photobacterium arenosum]|uniref:SEC-C metal-binding domain-containing protein n=1 Tax=Photobacterium arenosum TaxID=2774143 RepID=UPI00288BD2B4|nr:SEC-C metal-binding domain-containing protein [Photobacterium arenosum]
MTTLITLSDDWAGMPPAFIEGALLAANASPAAMEPDNWLPALVNGGLAEDEPVTISQQDRASILAHFEHQYLAIKSGEYSLPLDMKWQEAQGVSEAMGHFAEGFLAVWPYVAVHWENKTISDGTGRMLSALLTTCMLILDEAGTLTQMADDGVGGMPEPSALYANLPFMISEVVMAADELQQGGSSAQSINPYKGVGRNDSCPCGSGKKFKQCCGRKQ